MLLEVRNLEASYGSSQVLFGVDLEIEAGEAVALHAEDHAAGPLRMKGDGVDDERKERDQSSAHDL